MARTTLTEKTHARAVHLFKTNSAEDALQRVAFSKGAEWGWHARGRAERITKAIAVEAARVKEALRDDNYDGLVELIDQYERARRKA